MNVDEFYDRVKKELKVLMESDRTEEDMQTFRNKFTPEEIQFLKMNLEVQEKEDSNIFIVQNGYKKPKMTYIPNTKMMNKMFDEKETEYDVIVSSAREKKEIIVPYKVCSYELPVELTAYARSVLNSISGILLSGQKCMTYNQIYENMTGKKNKHPQAQGHVTQCVRRLMTTFISFDWTEHAKSKGINLDDKKTLITNEQLIYAKEVEIKSCGKTTNGGIVFLEVPTFLKYAKSVGQIINVDRNLIELNKININETVIVIRDYLIRRIEGMKNKKNNLHSKRINFDTLFKICELVTEGTQVARNKNTTIKILEEFKQNKYIKNFKEIIDGRKKIGIDIIL